MAKRIALKDKIMCDNVDLSNHARSFSFTSEHEQVDVSGFSSTGNDEFLAGKTTQSVTVEFFMDDASGSVWQTLYPLHRDRTSFDFSYRPDQTASVSATNPELSGTVKILSMPRGATRGEVEVATVTFVAADSTGLLWAAT